MSSFIKYVARLLITSLANDPLPANPSFPARPITGMRRSDAQTRVPPRSAPPASQEVELWGDYNVIFHAGNSFRQPGASWYSGLALTSLRTHCIEIQRFIPGQRAKGGIVSLCYTLVTVSRSSWGVQVELSALCAEEMIVLYTFCYSTPHNLSLTEIGLAYKKKGDDHKLNIIFPLFSNILLSYTPTFDKVLVQAPDIAMGRFMSLAFVWQGFCDIDVKARTRTRLIPPLTFVSSCCGSRKHLRTRAFTNLCTTHAFQIFTASFSTLFSWRQCTFSTITSRLIPCRYHEKIILKYIIWSWIIPGNQMVNITWTVIIVLPPN